MKTNKKMKTICIFLCCILLIYLFPINAFADYEDGANCEYCGAWRYDDWLCEGGDHCAIGYGCGHDHHCFGCEACEANCDWCDACCMCVDCAIDFKMHCLDCGTCGTDNSLCEECGRCYDSCGETCSEGEEHLCLKCHLEEGLACPDCGQCYVGDENARCSVCGTCSNCVGSYCEDCQMCVDCGINEKKHCPDCYECTQGEGCQICHRCFDCGGQCNAGCEDACLECHYDYEQACPDCGNCYINNEYEPCNDCGRCADCGSGWCDTCHRCLDCAVDTGHHCPGCQECLEDVSEYCESSLHCSSCANICPNCSGKCSECGVLCGNCGVCEDCTNICPLCGDSCELCVWSCEGCNACENCVAICQNCGNHCSECSVLCESCGFCESCAKICLLCGDYCSECGVLCGDCSTCEHCADICSECGNACSKCGKICDDCGLCEDCCGQVSEAAGCSHDVCVMRSDWSDHWKAEHGGLEHSHVYKPGYSTDTNDHWKSCKVCGKKADIEAHRDHLTHVPAKEKTCSADGNIEYYSCKCGMLFKDEAASLVISVPHSVVIPAIGHRYDRMTEVPYKAPTCSEAGNTRYYICPDCGHWIANISNRPIDIDSSRDYVAIPALGHNWSAWAETKPATATAEGVETRTCSRCGEKENRSITKLGVTSYKIIVNDGPNGWASASAGTAEAGTLITITAVPYSGYEVEHITWSTPKDYEYDITDIRTFTMPAGDATVDVAFKESTVPVIYTVTFDTNGHGAGPLEQQVPAGKMAQIPPKPTAEGWYFWGWYKEKACINHFNFDTLITSNITLYAKWTKTFVTPIYHTVTFDANGHDIAPAAQNVQGGTAVTKPADPTEAGWTFGGWYTEKLCENAFDFSTPIMLSRTLFAKWTEGGGEEPPGPKKYTVTFNTDGGSAIAQQTVEEGKMPTKPAAPTKEGFTFDGWYADGTFSVVFNFAAPITENTTVYAKWVKKGDTLIEIIYTVTSGANGTWARGSGKEYSLTVKRNMEDNTCFSHFTTVQINGTTLTAGTDYDAKPGSTIITLKAAALQKLSEGTHTLTVNFDDGKAESNLTITAASDTSGQDGSTETGGYIYLGLPYPVNFNSGKTASNLTIKATSGTSGQGSSSKTAENSPASLPKTGENSQNGLWLKLLALSLTVLGVVLLHGRRK